MKTILELRGVSAGYGGRSNRVKPILQNINLSVQEGELLVLAGPNGSGKTTLLKTAGGLLSPLEGSVLIKGKESRTLKSRERAKLTAFLFQVRDAPWSFTVRETVAQGRFARSGWLGSETREDRKATENALHKAELTHLAESPVTEISGGELQRVYIARSIAQGADLLLLDEPENSLDPKYAYMILQLLQTIVREGRSAIVSLHDLRLASRFADRVALLAPSQGIVALGTPDQVLTKETLGKTFDVSPELIESMVL